MPLSFSRSSPWPSRAKVEAGYGGGDSIIGGGDEDQVGRVNAPRRVIVGPAPGHHPRQALGRGPAAAGHGHHGVALLGQPHRQGRPHCPGPDKAYLVHRPLSSRMAGMPPRLWAVSTARTMAWATASAARAPRRLISPASSPVARAKTTSPSYIVWLGRMARARPSWAIWASLLACSLFNRALVATTARVVFWGKGLALAWDKTSRVLTKAVPARGPARISAVPGSTTSPKALTAAT